MEENQEFKVNLGYRRPCLKNKTVKEPKHTKPNRNLKKISADGSGIEKNQEKLIVCAGEGR